eukprot:gene3649-4584_t
MVDSPRISTLVKLFQLTSYVYNCTEPFFQNENLFVNLINHYKFPTLEGVMRHLSTEGIVPNIVFHGELNLVNHGVGYRRARMSRSTDVEKCKRTWANVTFVKNKLQKEWCNLFCRYYLLDERRT